MPKLPVVTPKKFARLVLKLGFRCSYTRGSHTYYIHPDKRIVCIAMHGKDIPTGTLFAIVKDIQLTKQEFINLLRDL